MRTSKIILLISSLLFAAISIVLICVLLLKSSIDPVLFEYSILLNIIKNCFASSIVFMVLFIAALILKQRLNTENVFIIFAVVIFITLVTFAFNSYKAYDNVWEVWVNDYNMNNSQEISSYFPYKEEIKKLDEENNFYQLSVSYSDDIIYVNVFDKIYNEVGYSVEYFEIDNYLLKNKIVADRETSSIFNNYSSEVFGEKSEGELKGIAYSVYVDDSDYIVVIKDGNKIYYSYLYEGERINISLYDFINTSVEQFGMIESLIDNPEIIM